MTCAWLGIETTSHTGSVALRGEGGVLARIDLPERKRHSELILPAVEQLFSMTGSPLGKVEGIAVSAGPGSYTGLRIGIATAEGLAAGWRTGLKGVSTLRILSSGTGSATPVLACMRARDGEVYAAVYSDCRSRSDVLLEPGAYTAGALAGLSGKYPGLAAVGSGRTELGDLHLDWVPAEQDVPDAATAAALGAELARVDGFDRVITPIYLRDFMEKASDAPS